MNDQIDFKMQVALLEVDYPAVYIAYLQSCGIGMQETLEAYIKNVYVWKMQGPALTNSTSMEEFFPLYRGSEMLNYSKKVIVLKFILRCLVNEAEVYGSEDSLYTGEQTHLN